MLILGNHNVLSLDLIAEVLPCNNLFHGSFQVLRINVDALLRVQIVGNKNKGITAFPFQLGDGLLYRNIVHFNRQRLRSSRGRSPQHCKACGQ